MTLKHLSIAPLVLLAVLLPRDASAQVTLSSGMALMDKPRRTAMTGLIGARAEFALSFLDAYTGAFWRGREVHCIAIARCPPGHGPHVVAGIGRQGGEEGAARTYALVGLGWTFWTGNDCEGAALVEAEGGVRLPLLGRTGLVLGVRAERGIRHEATRFGAFGGVSVRLGAPGG